MMVHGQDLFLAITGDQKAINNKIVELCKNQIDRPRLGYLAIFLGLDFSLICNYNTFTALVTLNIHSYILKLSLIQ